MNYVHSLDYPGLETCCARVMSQNLFHALWYLHTGVIDALPASLDLSKCPPEMADIVIHSLPTAFHQYLPKVETKMRCNYHMTGSKTKDTFEDMSVAELFADHMTFRVLSTYYDNDDAYIRNGQFCYLGPTPCGRALFASMSCDFDVTEYETRSVIDGWKLNAGNGLKTRSYAVVSRNCELDQCADREVDFYLATKGLVKMEEGDVKEEGRVEHADQSVLEIVRIYRKAWKKGQAQGQ